MTRSTVPGNTEKKHTVKHSAKHCETLWGKIRSQSSTEYNTVEHCEKISYKVIRSTVPNITEKNTVKHGVKHCGTLWNRIRSQSSTEYNTVEHREINM